MTESINANGKSLCLEAMLESKNKVSGSQINEPAFIFDTHVVKYKFSGGPQKVLFTENVMEEMRKWQHKFPEEAINQIGRVFNPEIITPFVSIHDEFYIGYAATLNLKANRQKEKEEHRRTGIGWVDVEQIGVALSRARNGEQSALVSNDPDIYGTVKGLHELLPYTKEYITTISIKNYLIHKYKERLNRIKKPFRFALINEIESQYIAAAA